MRPIKRITTAETNSSKLSYMMLMYSQKTLFFIGDVIFVTVKSLIVAAAAAAAGPPRICGLHPPIKTGLVREHLRMKDFFQSRERERQRSQVE